MDILAGGPMLKVLYAFNLPPVLMLAKADDVAWAAADPPKAPTNEPKNPV